MLASDSPSEGALMDLLMMVLTGGSAILECALVFTAAWVASAFALPFLLGEAAWAFALLIAPVVLLAIVALPVAIFTAIRAVHFVVAGRDGRRWVLPLSAAVLIGAIGLLVVFARRLWA
jgi:hypothetical protein